jgi:membrane peptidoglycan carboxypeptidase
LRILLGHIAKRLYKEKFEQLRDRLLLEYEIVKVDKTKNYNTLSKILISGEDHRFHYHIGFDFIAILRAVRNRIFYKKVEGASTIEQQLVRVLTNDFERTFKRKIQEIVLSTTVSSIIPKNEIPKIYLNVAYYGAGMNGLNQTFSKLGIVDREILPIEQAAEIVSRIKYPQPSNPNQNRLRQIEIRKQHLIKLYNSHSNRKYFKIYG